jgi:hypothetical protein
VNKYTYLSSITPDAVARGRGVITLVYPETKEQFDAWDKNGGTGCRSCKKQTYSRAILMVMLETSKGDRDVSSLKKALPADFVNIL